MAFTATAWGLETLRDEAWEVSAACKGLPDPELMWPFPGTGDNELAVSVCQRCPVRLECLDQGAQVQDWESIRGGLTGQERELAHRDGLAPQDYPPHVAEPRKCCRCSNPFTPDPESPSGRVCGACQTGSRMYMRLPDVIARWEQLRHLGMTRSQMAAALGYTTWHGLGKALRKATRLGLIPEVGP